MVKCPMTIAVINDKKSSIGKVKYPRALIFIICGNQNSVGVTRAKWIIKSRKTTLARHGICIRASGYSRDGQSEPAG